MSENTVLRSRFGNKGEGATGGSTKLRKEDRHIIISSLHIVSEIRSKKIRRRRRVRYEKIKGRGPLARPRRRFEDNINMHLKEVVCEGVDYIHVT
jgi:hypothetical protein